jgi:hypothetical protein
LSLRPLLAKRKKMPDRTRCTVHCNSRSVPRLDIPRRWVRVRLVRRSYVRGCYVLASFPHRHGNTI